MTAPLQKFKLIFFVPASALTPCKAAIFSAGAGRYPGYTECCFTSRGTGQFRPIEGADPHIGKVGALEEVDEWRVETVCVGRETVGRVVEALKKAHPYEEPAYDVYRMEDF
ncbi:hypothetical protein P153DRAFT_396265 [Dothidotthia symphoricarpi CBS 119687]|uniref:ATP phosphoribosyltransferase n=1 Tax=Dothidotthia symphoricarpi CBS 119687 TaxID=1392245 RepID=A0A6A6AED0_9PLEO|nr:uncharacterized protein P153DRAFT_396265 [Dothidotthia symphoricarpi CBS 119687]KAF2129926.1 hypothetical protein P153DRAFT_396265 [Dothidotthia symphoricarpi CBS 119687]